MSMKNKVAIKIRKKPKRIYSIDYWISQLLHRKCVWEVKEAEKEQQVHILATSYTITAISQTLVFEKLSKQRKKKGTHTRNIIHNNSNRRIPDIARNKTPESLLTSCIPVHMFQLSMLIYQMMIWNVTERGFRSYHSWSLAVRSSRYIVFDRKSIPIVAWMIMKQHKLLRKRRTRSDAFVHQLIISTNQDEQL